MHRTTRHCLALVLLLGLMTGVGSPVALADDEPPAEPPAQEQPGDEKPVEEMTEDERDDALKRAEELNGQVVALYRQGKYGEALRLAHEVMSIREKALEPDHPLMASSLTNLAALLAAQGQYEEARTLIERAVGIKEKTFGPDDPSVAASLIWLAQLLKRQGQYAEARPLLERAVRIKEKALGPDHPSVTTSVSNLAVLLNAQGQYAEARLLFERVLRDTEKTLGPDHPDVALSLRNLAVVLNAQGQYEESRPLLERALGITEKALGPDHPSVATGLRGLGVLLMAQGQYEEARPLYERALGIAERALGPDHPDVAMSLSGLATALGAQGLYEKARPLCERALAIREKTFGPDHPDVAASLNDLALLLVPMGQYEEARPLYERALGITEKALGPDHPSVATNLNNLAGLLETQGQYEEAKPLYERALGIMEKALGPDHPSVATSHNNLALLLDARGQYEKARPLYERALRIREKAFGPDHPDVAESLNNLALLLGHMGQHEEARSLCERALGIMEEALGSEHPLVATNLGNLAVLLNAQGQYEESRLLLERALRIEEKTFGPDHPMVARSLNNLAESLTDLGEYEKARPLYERALEINEKALGSDHPDVAQMLNNLAILLEGMGQHERAASLLQRCLDIDEQNIRRNFLSLQTPERLAMIRSLRGHLDNWLQLAHDLDRSGHTEVLRFKGLVARATSAERRLARQGGAEVEGRIRDLRVSGRRLAKLANSVPSGFPREGRKERRRAWQEAYAKAAADREELALALARDFAPERGGLERLGLRLPDIQAQLGEGEVLLDYLRSGDRYLVWAVSPTVEPERIDLGRAEAIESAAAEFADRTADSDDDGARLEAGKVLRDLVFTPIEKRLGEGVSTIYLCPDAALAAVPFAALPGKTDDTSLIDDYLLVSVSMAQDLVPWKDQAQRGKGALLLGGVDYGKASEGEEEAIGQSLRSLAAVDRAPRGGDFVQLPGTADEVRFIGPRFGEDVIMLGGADATEARFRAGARGRCVVHLATHGFVRDDLMRGLRRRKDDQTWLGAGMERQLAQGYDPMLLAGLAMAGASPREGGHGDDGILTALEASHLDLDGVELVVLSACETALGRAESGEGVIGLVRGFQMAGAKRVVGSLWRVDDDATRVLMVRFYELWSPDEGEGLPAAEALKRAQMFVRGHEKWERPYYWAAWVAYGT